MVVDNLCLNFVRIHCLVSLVWLSFFFNLLQDSKSPSPCRVPSKLSHPRCIPSILDKIVHELFSSVVVFVFEKYLNEQ